jgi:hypothetical protein
MKEIFSLYTFRKVGIAFIVFILPCCNNTNHQSWDQVSIDPEIATNPVYVALDKQPEIFSAGENSDTLHKRSSDVINTTEENINPADSFYAKYNNCRANLIHDTLDIAIGIGSLFGGNGFSISYCNGKFITEPFSWTDIAYAGTPVPTYKIKYQRLILNKISYRIADSLYGYIDCKIIETIANRRITHLAKGYFRSRIEKADDVQEFLKQ